MFNNKMSGLMQVSKEEQVTVAKRMKKLCATDNNSTEAAAFISDVITLMNLVLKKAKGEGN